MHRRLAVPIAILASVAFAAHFLWIIHVSASPISDKTIRFLDGAGEPEQSFAHGDIAVVFVRDDGLGGPATSTGTWTNIDATVAAGTWWSLATGAPQETVYSISPSGVYDTATPANTPLVLPPGQWVAAVDGTDTLVTDFNATSGEIRLLTDANAGSTVEVHFLFEVVDTFSVDDLIVRIVSTSDSDGEWVAVSEVVNETDSSPSTTSGLFRGQVELSGDAAASGVGDGAVQVEDGDTVTATYFEPGGVVAIDVHAVAVSASGPTPTPVPGAGVAALALLAGILALLMAPKLGTRWGRRG